MRICWSLHKRAGTGVCSGARAFSAILWNAASPDSFESTLGFQTRKAFDLPPPVSLPGREPSLFLSLSPPIPQCLPPLPLSLSQLGWTHTWKCWPVSTLRPNLVIQRRGRGSVEEVVVVEEDGRSVWVCVCVGGGWKGQPPQDQKQPQLRPANPTSALYKDLPPHPNFDSHAISQ